MQNTLKREMEALGVDNLGFHGPMHTVCFSLADITYRKVSDRSVGLVIHGG